LSGEASLVRVLSKRNFKVVFSVAPEPLAIWNKKLEGLESSELKKLKISPEDIYLAAPDPVSGFFYEKNSNERSFCSLLM
jgi:hypothetical protein